MDRRRLALAAAALALLGLAFFASRCTDEAERAQDPAKQAAHDAKRKARESARRVSYPRDRIRRAADSPLATDRPEAAPPAAKDPILAAMASPEGGGAVFVEVNAIRHSPLVEKVLRCREDDAMRELDALKEVTGVNVLEDVDRLALGKDALGISGYFGDLQQPEGVTRVGEYGDAGEIFTYEGKGEKKGYYATVGDNLLIAGESAEQLQAAIDRVEGRAEVVDAMPAAATNSEIYGNVGAGFIQGLLKGSKDPMAQQVAELVTGGVIRLNVDEHVSASFDITAIDAEAGENLSKTVGGALSLARREAEAKGDHELAALLERARVIPKDDGGFGLDMAVPGDTLLSMLGCPQGDAASE